MKKNPEKIKSNHDVIVRLEGIKAELIKIKNQIS